MQNERVWYLKSVEVMSFNFLKHYYTLLKYIQSKLE